jgi:hypothetical protein
MNIIFNHVTEEALVFDDHGQQVGGVIATGEGIKVSGFGVLGARSYVPSIQLTDQADVVLRFLPVLTS